MKLVEDGESVLPGIRVLSAPGHTFGHVVVEIVSEAEKLLYLADTALHPIHLEHADWTASVDQIPEQAVKTRRAFYERAAQPETLVLFFHFYPFPSLGYILKQGESWRWKPHDRDTALSPGLAG
jgi:glyoxylase-like metal-dependent hydrolase (beta-lactamase superfamily II)